MDLLASYDDEQDSSTPASPRQSKADDRGEALENEWLSFEKMIAPGGVTGVSQPVDQSTYLVDGVVSYPGVAASRTLSQTEDVAPVVQSSASSDSETEADKQNVADPEANGKCVDEEEDDAFFKMRKQVKERDRSSSSDRSSRSSSSASSRSGSREKGSLSPPHLSPVNSVKSHASDPPELGSPGKTAEKEEQEESAVKATDEETEKKEEGKEGRGSKSRERKRSHRDRSRSRHRDHGSSRSKKHRRSRSRSKDRKHHSSRDKHRHKDKKRHSSRERKRSKSKERSGKSGENKESRIGRSKRSRSRSKERREKKKDRKRSRSKERRRSRSREKKRSKSRDRKRKHRSRSRGRRSKSKGRRSRSRSRDRRSRSRSRERLRSRSPALGRKLTFKEQMRKEILAASKQASAEKTGPDAVELPLKRPGEPLKPSDLLKGVKISAGESVTPQMALMQTMAAMHKKAQELTGVEVPKYYNPAAVNPLKYAEQVQKRKLLWSKKPDNKQKEKDDQMENNWKSAFIASEDDGKTVSKFRKLMGMKEDLDNNSLSEDIAKKSEEQKRKQDELFNRLDQEYQFARITTHTQRGVGLGFSSQVYDPNHPATAPP